MLAGFSVGNHIFSTEPLPGLGSGFPNASTLNAGSTTKNPNNKRVRNCVFQTFVNYWALKTMLNRWTNIVNILSEE